MGSWYSGEEEGRKTTMDDVETTQLTLTSRDFYTCWNALTTSERSFQDALDRRDFSGYTAAELQGVLGAIREAKGKIEAILRPEGRWPIDEP